MGRRICDHEHSLAGITRPILHEHHLETALHVFRNVITTISLHLADVLNHLINVLGERLDLESALSHVNIAKAHKGNAH